MKKEIVCNVIDDIRVCVDKNHPRPFEHIKEAYTIMRENTDYYLQFSKSCKTQGLQCFSSNFHDLSFYFIIYLLAGFLVNFFHELFHFCVFYFSREDTEGFSFGFNLGTTFLSHFPSVSDHSVWWWYLAIMGPLLFVNFFSIVIVYSLNRPRSSYRLFQIRNAYYERASNVFLRAIAYISSLSILINTVFSPLFQFVALESNIKSDFMWGWEISLEMSNEKYMFSEYYILFLIVIIGGLILISYKVQSHIRNVIIVFIVILLLSLIFFNNGISDRSLFQWMMVSSVTVEIIFAIIYVLKFGKKSY